MADFNQRLGRVRDASIPWATCVGLLLVFAIVAISVQFMATERASRLALAEPVEVELRDYVILPGREQAVRELLAPLEAGALTGVLQYSFALERNVVQVQLFGEHLDDRGTCPGPEWVRAPGAFVLTRAPSPTSEPVSGASGMVQHGDLWLQWYWCANQRPADPELMMAALVEALAGRPELAEIWQAVGSESLGPEAEPTTVRQSGLLTPMVERTGLDHERFTIALLLLGTLSSGLVAFGLRTRLPITTPSRADAPRWRWRWLAALVLVLASVLLRVATGIEREFDADESWGYPLGGSIFAENHDPWVHPPLFHLVQQPWIRAIGWQPGDSVLYLRAPMIGFGLLATTLVIVRVAAWMRTPWLGLLALPCALAPTLAQTLVLARPYALAAVLLVMCALALWPISNPREPAWTARARWWLALVCAGLAAWTDVIAGLAAVALVLARLGSCPRGDAWAKLTVLFALALWMLPLIPGALTAATHHIDPNVSQATLDALGYERPGDVRPDADLTTRLPAFCVFGLRLRAWPVGMLGVALLVTLAMVGWRDSQHRLAALLPLLMLMLSLLAASLLVHLRPRNVAFAPVLAAVLAARVLTRERDESDPNQEAPRTSRSATSQTPRSAASPVM
jgi:hypothetical protein